MNSNNINHHNHHQQPQKKKVKLDYFINDNNNLEQQQQQQQQDHLKSNTQTTFTNNDNNKNQVEILFDPGINIDDYYGDGDGDDDDDDEEYENYEINSSSMANSNNINDNIDLQEAKTTNGKKTRKGNKNKKTKGRVKIRMEYIENKIRRYTTFSKRKTGIMKKAYELSTLTGTQVMLLVASETGHVYTFATKKFQPMITEEVGKNLIRDCLSSSDDFNATDDKTVVNSDLNQVVNDGHDEVEVEDDAGGEDEDESETIKEPYMRFVTENNDETHKLSTSTNRKLPPSYKNHIKETTPPPSKILPTSISTTTTTTYQQQQTLPKSLKTNDSSDQQQQIILSHSLLSQDNLIFNLTNNTNNSNNPFSTQSKFTNVTAINSNNPLYVYPPVNIGNNLNNSILVRTQRSEESDVNR